MARERRKNRLEEEMMNVPRFEVNVPNLFEFMLGHVGFDAKYVPNKILKSGNATIVFWNDGTKTIVKLPEGDTPDDYAAFTAALAKKVFGTNTQVKKIIKTKTEIQKPKEKKGDTDAVLSTPTESVE